MSRRNPTDAGAATLLGLVLIVVIVLGAAAVSQVARAVVLARQASAAADLAALAAANAIVDFAADPCSAAAIVARANRADVISCEVRHPPDGAEVTLEVRGQQVTLLPASTAEASAGLRPVMQSPTASASPP